MSQVPLTGRGLAAVLVAVTVTVVGSVTGSRAALTAGVLLGSLVVTSFVAQLLVRPARVGERRTAPDAVERGETTSVTASVIVPEWAAGLIRISHDSAPAGVHAWGVTSELVSAPASPVGARRARLAVRYRATGLVRGVWEFGDVTLSVFDPFGFTRRGVSVTCAGSMHVTPVIRPVPRLALPPHARGREARGSLTSGHGMDDVVPRPYVQGDAIRRIHWRASARLGDLMVRDEEQQVQPSALVVIDRTSWPRTRDDDDILSFTGPPEPDTFDTALDLVLSLTAGLTRQGATVLVTTETGDVLGHPNGSQPGVLHAVRELGRGLADLQTHHSRRQDAVTFPRMDRTFLISSSGERALLLAASGGLEHVTIFAAAGAHARAIHAITPGADPAAMLAEVA